MSQNFFNDQTNDSIRSGITSYYVSCILQGEFCEDLDVIIHCNADLCADGDCEEDGRGQYHCVCSPGYIGLHCDIFDPCYGMFSSNKYMCFVCVCVC